MYRLLVLLILGIVVLGPSCGGKTSTPASTYNLTSTNTIPSYTPAIINTQPTYTLETTNTQPTYNLSTLTRPPLIPDMLLPLPLPAPAPTPTPTPALKPVNVVTGGTETINLGSSVDQSGGLSLLNGVVTASNVTPGGTGTFQATLQNTSEDEYSISVHYSSPDSTREGYISLKDMAKTWVTFTPQTLEILPKSLAHVLVNLSIPTTAKLPGRKLEFWVTYDCKPGGTFIYSYNQRWLLEISPDIAIK